jgi:hypothetical protein
VKQTPLLMAPFSCCCNATRSRSACLLACRRALHAFILRGMGSKEEEVWGLTERRAAQLTRDRVLGTPYFLAFLHAPVERRCISSNEQSSGAVKPTHSRNPFCAFWGCGVVCCCSAASRSASTRAAAFSSSVNNSCGAVCCFCNVHQSASCSSKARAVAAALSRFSFLFARRRSLAFMVTGLGCEGK